MAAGGRKRLDCSYIREGVPRSSNCRLLPRAHLRRAAGEACEEAGRGWKERGGRGVSWRGGRTEACGKAASRACLLQRVEGSRVAAASIHSWREGLALMRLWGCSLVSSDVT